MLQMALLLAAWTGGFAALCYVALRKWDDPWRDRGWYPTIILALWDMYLIASVAGDPSSHNLWPVEAIAVTVLALIVLAGIAIARDIAIRPRKAG
jgi:hypothetical protein